MAIYRMRLACIDEAERPVFLTWRLQGSLPSRWGLPADARHSGLAFAATDRMLEQAHAGPAHFRQPAVADMMVQAIRYNARVLGHYQLHSFVVMPNHVHLLATPAVALRKLTDALQGVTAVRSQAMLALEDGPFWQEDSYTRMVRYEAEFEEIRNFIEADPVRAGMVSEASEYRWSSAAADEIAPQGGAWRVTPIRSSGNLWTHAPARQGA